MIDAIDTSGFRRKARLVAILADETGWHTTQLRRALARRGLEGRCVDLADCRIDTARACHGLVIPGFGGDLPAAAIVRGIAGGSFEQVTRRLGVLHALRECGVPVYNDARAIERSVDKSMTSLLLSQAGVPTPATWAVESTVDARRILMRETTAGRSLVLKPLFGSQGKGVQRVGAVDGAFVPLPDLDAYGGVAYLQRFVPQADVPGFDLRVLVIGGRAVCAMKRVGADWIRNVARGARCVPTALTSELTATAEAASAALELDYAGVDLMYDGGTPNRALVVEVNGVAAWRGLQSVSTCDIAQCLVDDLIDRRMASASLAVSGGAA